MLQFLENGSEVEDVKADVPLALIKPWHAKWSEVIHLVPAQNVPKN